MVVNIIPSGFQSFIFCNFQLCVAHTFLFVISIVFKRHLAGEGGFANSNEKHENKLAKLTWIVGGCLVVLLLVLTTALKSICDSKQKQSRVDADKQKQEDAAARDSKKQAIVDNNDPAKTGDNLLGSERFAEESEPLKGKSQTPSDVSISKTQNPNTSAVTLADTSNQRMNAEQTHLINQQPIQKRTPQAMQSSQNNETIDFTKSNQRQQMNDSNRDGLLPDINKARNAFVVEEMPNIDDRGNAAALADKDTAQQ